MIKKIIILKNIKIADKVLSVVGTVVIFISTATAIFPAERKFTSLFFSNYDLAPGKGNIVECITNEADYCVRDKPRSIWCKLKKML